MEIIDNINEKIKDDMSIEIKKLKRRLKKNKMEKLKMCSVDNVDKNIEKIGKLFPNCLTEKINESGEVELAIDFDRLKQELSKEIVEGNEERYQFTWPDKGKAELLANSPISKTLRPSREESIDFDNTENLYIEGDNLEVLKLLQETYLKKIKMIYIDPPYNTYKDFIYNDKFSKNIDEYLANSGQFDEEGNRLVRNTESKGRIHTDWLNMIYPRLKVAEKLLSDDGVIFISIDDREVRNMKLVCDEIFHENNFISQLVWQNKKGGGNDSTYIAVEHEYILVYAKNKYSLKEFYEKYSDEYLKRYKEEDEKGKYYWDTFKRKSGKQYYPIECPDGTVLELDEDGNPISWLRSKLRFDQDKKDGEIKIISTNNKWSVQFKQRMPQGKKPRSIFTTKTIIDDKGTTSTGSNDIYEYFKKDIFSNPKPVELLEYLLGFGMSSDGIVLDFFSGSGTIAECVMKLNKSDAGKRKYIAIQLREDIDKVLSSSSMEAKRIAQNAIDILDELEKPHYITELAKERIKRAGLKLKEDNILFNLDIGFRVLKVDSSNMEDVYYQPKDVVKSLLDMMSDNIKSDRTSEDLLFQVMLDLGVPLSSRIEKIMIDEKEVFVVENGYLIACFDKNITEETIKELALKKPYYFIMRDSSMANDNVATNFEQIFVTYSPGTIKKVL